MRWDLAVNYLFSFRGRVGRAKFWLFLPIFVAGRLIYAGGLFLSDSSSVLAISVVLSIVSFLIFVACIVILAAIWTKRLHDREKSAWYLILFWVLPGLLMDFVLGWTTISFAIAVNLWAFVELGCLRGTVGPNKYGPDPLEERQDVRTEPAGRAEAVRVSGPRD